MAVGLRIAIFDNDLTNHGATPLAENVDSTLCKPISSASAIDVGFSGPADVVPLFGVSFFFIRDMLGSGFAIGIFESGSESLLFAGCLFLR